MGLVYARCCKVSAQPCNLIINTSGLTLSLLSRDAVCIDMECLAKQQVADADSAAHKELTPFPAVPVAAAALSGMGSGVNSRVASDAADRRLQPCCDKASPIPILSRLLRRFPAPVPVSCSDAQLLLLPEFQPANRKQLISLVACALETVFGSPARKNDRLPSDTKLITAFHSVSVPSMTIQSYFLRLAEFINCSGECFILCLVHINRIHVTKPEVAIDALTVHRLLLTSLMCSAKFFDDHVYNNAMWANVGGVAIKEMNMLEREFLSLVDYSMYVGTEEFLCAYNEIVHPALHTKCNAGSKCFFNIKHYPLPIPHTSSANSNVRDEAAQQHIQKQNDIPTNSQHLNDDTARAAVEVKRAGSGNITSSVGMGMYMGAAAGSSSNVYSSFGYIPIWGRETRIRSLIASSLALELPPPPPLPDRERLHQQSSQISLASAFCFPALTTSGDDSSAGCRLGALAPKWNAANTAWVRIGTAWVHIGNGQSSQSLSVNGNATCAVADAGHYIFMSAKLSPHPGVKTGNSNSQGLKRCKSQPELRRGLPDQVLRMGASSSRIGEC